MFFVNNRGQITPLRPNKHFGDSGKKAMVEKWLAESKPGEVLVIGAAESLINCGDAAPLKLVETKQYRAVPIDTLDLDEEDCDEDDED